jgi:DNA polymerase elongation subunit (family B)
MKPIAVFDTECYRNYYLVAFLDTETGKVKCIEQREGVPLDVVMIRKILKKYTVVGFNSLNYDLPILSAAIAGGHDLKNLSDGIIKFRLKAWQFYDKYEVQQYPCDMIDLIEVAPGMGSLKVYGARLHSKTLWDLPCHPDEVLTDAQMDEIREYCVNDLQTTLDLWNYLQPQIKLREQMSRVYDVDLRSKSDAQMAEAVTKKLLQDKYGVRAKKPVLDKDYSFKYQAPKYLKGKLNGLVDEMEAITFRLEESGSVETPVELKNKIVEIGQNKYRMGIGGLHSCEEKRSCYSNEKEIVDIDCTSYYPSIVINNSYYPSHIKDMMGVLYKGFYLDRVDLKKKLKDLL